MAKKYVKVRMWKETFKNFKMKAINIKLETGKAPIMTRLLHAVSKQPFYPDEAGVSLRDLTKRRKPLI